MLFLNHPAILELIALVRWLFNPSLFRFLSTLLLRRKSKFFPLCDKLKDNEVVYSFEKVISIFRPFVSIEVCVGHSFLELFGYATTLGCSSSWCWSLNCVYSPNGLCLTHCMNLDEGRFSFTNLIMVLLLSVSTALPLRNR